MEFVKSMVKTGKEYLQSYKKTKALVKINRNDVMVAARAFNESNIDSKKAQRTITELIYLFNQGEIFSEEEVIQIFFAITKLFRSPSAELRRMVYQMIKQMKSQSSIYIVTQCLVKDIQDKNDYFKINSLRTIHLVLDSSNLPQIERYIKTLILNKNTGVACAALLCGIQLFEGHEQLVRKWISEVTQQLNTKESKTQLQALILLNVIKRKDAIGFKKTLTSMMPDVLPEMAAVQLIRFLKQHIEEVQSASADATSITNFLLKQTRRSQVAVAIEAAKLACQSSLMSNKDILDIIKLMDSHLIGSNTVKRYSVLKLYNKLLKNPSRRSLMMNISQIERVLSDKNKSLSALAASILLRMCTENQLDKLFNQISQSMNEMSDDYKIDVLNSIKNVIKQYPGKYKLVNQFLIKFIYTQKKYEFVKTTIDVMEYQIKTIGGEAKKECLKLISQFLMKLDFEKIHFQILGIISREVNSQDIQSDFLKHLIAQIYLQSGAVRACSLSTLQKLSNFPSTKQKLLKRVVSQFQNDEDEEVRYRSIPKKSVNSYNSFQLDMLQTYLFHNLNNIQAAANPQLLDWEKIKEWGQGTGANIILNNQKNQKQVRIKQEIDAQQEQKQRLSSIIDSHKTFSKYGKLLKVSSPITLTENDSEFQIKLKKLFFQENIILQYSVTNRIPNTVLEQAKIQLKHDTKRLKVIHMIAAKQIKYNETSEIFLGLEILPPNQDEEQEEESEYYVTTTLSSILKYKLKELKGNKVTTQYEDQYPLNDNQLTFGDYMSPLFLAKGSFPQNWQKYEVKQQLVTFGLPYQNTQAAIKQLKKHFGMAVVEAGAEDSGKKANVQVCNFSGMYLNKERVLMQCTVGFSTTSGCMLQIKIKCQDQSLAEDIMNSIS